MGYCLSHFSERKSGSIAILLLFWFAYATGQETDVWHGHQMLEFTIAGQNARLVLPRQFNEQRHWIWRVRFWGHEPQTDLALLHRGFAVAWIDLTDLYGSPRAIEIGDEFYAHLVRNFQLNQRPVLEGFSRGGLMAYHWALAHPDLVSCIYADAPVLDIYSWPGGFGKSRGSPADWEKCKLAYGLEEHDKFNGGPIDRAMALAEANIPLLHICGAADSIVPYEENTGRLDRVLRAHGAKMEIILKAGVGHHPHSLDDPRPIIRFILNHTDPDLIRPEELELCLPSINYRDRWNQSILHKSDAELVRIAFLGGSITYGGGWRDSLQTFFETKFPTKKFQFINAGIPSMGSTPGAFRLRKDVLQYGPIDLLFVEAAVNDATNGRSSKAQIRGMEGIIRQVLRTYKQTDIIMMHFVDPDKMADYNQGTVPEVIVNHEKVAEHYGITSINLAKEVNDRILNGEFTWQDDFKDLHPSPFGHGVYARTIIGALEKLMRDEQRMLSALPAPIDTFSYDDGRLLEPSRANLISGWVYHRSWLPNDTLSTRPGFVEVPLIEALNPGAELTYNFSGRGIGVLVPAGGDVGMLQFQIDDQPPQTLDQFTRWSHFLHLPWLYMLADELHPGAHHLRLTVAAEKNENSRGYACRIFSFAVNK